MVENHVSNLNFGNTLCIIKAMTAISKVDCMGLFQRKLSHVFIMLLQIMKIDFELTMCFFNKYSTQRPYDHFLL